MSQALQPLPDQFSGPIRTRKNTPAGKYSITTELGRGGRSVIHEGKKEDSGEIVVIKEISGEHPFLSDAILREGRLLKRKYSERIIQIHEIIPPNQVIMEKLTGCSLSDYIKEGLRIQQTNNKIAFYDQIFWIIKEVALGLADIHADEIIHRDIKPDNLFLTKNSKCEKIVKIIDFDASRKGEITELPENSDSYYTEGTPEYMAPEQVMGYAFLSGDIYSLGLCLAEAILGERKYRGIYCFEDKLKTTSGSNVESIMEMLKLRIKLPPENIEKYDSHIPKKLNQLINYCLNPNPIDRPTANELISLTNL